MYDLWHNIRNITNNQRHNVNPYGETMRVKIKISHENFKVNINFMRGYMF